MGSVDLYIRSLPYLDKKWLKADLNSALRSNEDLAILWNNLVQDNEISLHNAIPVVNSSGNLSYVNEYGGHYCGVELLSCTCCSGYCISTSNCNCKSCNQLDIEDAGSKKNQNILNQLQSFTSSEAILDSWLWGPVPNVEQKSNCIKSLLSEQREISLRSAGNCLSSMHLKQRLFVYDRYFTALARTKIEKNEISRKVVESPLDQKNQKFNGVDSPSQKSDKATIGLARVGTRAALNFSFAFLRRAWRSGEDTELCSELLLEALEALQDLPEASLFDTSQISQLWIDVLERSIKFLRQVVLGDVSGGRCSVPRDDRYIALSLLLELAAQKGTLGASLEAVMLLLTLWEKEKETDDNRALPQETGAPLVPVLRRYEQISNYGLGISPDSAAASPTESFLRFLSLPETDTIPIDLKQGAVVIISHLDRLAKPHLPTRNYTVKTNSKQSQQIFTLGWQCLSSEYHGFTEEPITGVSSFPGMSSHYTAATLDLGGSIIVSEVVCSESNILILSNKGDVFILSSLSSGNTTPSLVDGFESSAITHITAHCEGKHFLALSSDQEVYSWGTGEGGRLGHGDTNPRETPTKIQALSEKFVTAIFCGATYSAAITESGQLYTWGRGTYGRLGHGTSDDKFTPVQVQALKDYKVIDVALGTGDSHTICVTEEGIVFAWGDGDFGKLGNDCISGSQLPVQIETLSRIVKVFSGAQFSVALSVDGFIYTWGKGHGGRLGHGNSDHLSSPKLIESLSGKKIIDLAVGSAHCLALSNNGEVYGWGRNDYQQICPPSICRDPIILTPILATPVSLRVSGISCGPAQSIVWSHTSTMGIPTRIPFVIDLTEQCFRLLELLLGMVTGHSPNGEMRQPPSQEAECIAVACLNLLRLQLHAVIANNIVPKNIGLGEGSRLLSSLKTRILGLAGGPTVLKTMQEAAQWALQAGWSVLLPTASERAQTLTSLLPSGIESGISTSGHRFMTDLLVGSLMAEGGLQTALNQAINFEPEDCSNSHNLPLLHLVKQLLRNNSAMTQARLSQLLIGSYLKGENDCLSPEPPSPSIDLLHRFQRLLLSHIHQTKTDDLAGAEALLGKYATHVISLCVTTLKKAHEVALQSKDGVDDVLKSDISDTLLYELLIGLILLHRDKPTILPGFSWTKNLIPLLHSLDNLNRLVHDCEVQDTDDMSWPAIICRGTQKSTPIQEESCLIRKSDLENHCMDGGKWIIINGMVFDVQDYQCENAATTDLLSNSAGKDLSSEFSQPQHRTALEYITTHLRVGKYATNETDEKQMSKSIVLLTHFNSERALAYLLGLRAGLLQKGPPVQQAEIQCKSLMKSLILGGGLQVLQPTNPFDEEKGEARSSASTAGSTPTEASSNIPIRVRPHISSWPHTQVSIRVDSLLYGLGESRLTEPLIIAWVTLSERYCKQNNLMWHQEFPPEHPIQELERLLSAVLIRHQGMGPLVLAVLDRELSGTAASKPPKPIIDIIRTVHQTKWNLIRTRQQLNRSYKEVCAPMLDRCRFLLFEVRPAISMEQTGLQRLNILHRHPRFKTLVKKIIVEIRNARDQLESGKPEDILNVTIQSQNTSMRTQSTVATDKEETFDFIDTSNEVEIENKDAGDVIGGGDRENIYSDKRNVITPGDEIKTPTNESNNFERKTKDFDSTEQFINDVIIKLSEKSMQETETIDSHFGIMNQIVEFVLQDICDVETLRRAMYCQVQRYQIRKQGIEMFTELLKVSSDVFEAVRYNLLSGYLGLYLDKSKQHSLDNILEDLNMITAFQKAEIIIKYSKILEWAINDLQKFINQEQIFGKHKYHLGKDNSNLGTYVFLKKISRARFLLSVFGILSKDLGPNEISLLINSGILGSILGLLRQTGGDVASSKIGNELSVLYEDTVMKQKSSKANLTGPELAKLMKIGTKVVRGTDWKWGDQDGPPPGEGVIVSEVGEDGWVRVKWDTGSTNSYRMGKEGLYDLRLADTASNITSPDIESEKDDMLSELQLTGDSHPTKLLKHSCIKMLQILSVGVGQHGDKMQKSAVKVLSSMFRNILNSKTGCLNFGLENWTTFGFLRSISSSKILSKFVTSDMWMDFHINVLDSQILQGEQDVYKKIQCLRLLQSTLVNWNEEDQDKISILIERLFHTLGRICLFCPNDLSLIQNPADVKSRVLLSASYSGTIAEELISLLRKLHTLPLWNGIINSFLSQKLCVAADLLTEHDIESNLETEKIFVMGTLKVIGGCDPRPRIGLNLTHEGQRGTIAKFTSKGSILMNVHQTGEAKKLTIMQVNDCAAVGAFSLSKLPINEILLNSWSVLIFGPGERKLLINGNINISLLRSQQVQLSTLNATCVLFRNQNILRKVLRQRSPGFLRYNSEGSLSDKENGIDTDATNSPKGSQQESNSSDEQNNLNRESEFLVQSILVRATQPSPLKAIYSYQELSLAALNLSQMLASHVHAEINAPVSIVRPPPPSITPTLIHGVPIYNDAVLDDLPTPLGEDSNLFYSKKPPCPLISKIMEMGFPRKSIELAIKVLTSHTEAPPSAEQIIQWIIEHPDQCPRPQLPGPSGQGVVSEPCPESDSESITSEAEELHQQPLHRYQTRDDFKTADQYAMYVRGIVCPGMTVRCCHDFEEIRKGDIGTVLKVDTEGLHDLNVQVDWQMHESSYWMCFVHIEILEPPKEGPTDANPIVVGNHVRIKGSTPRGKSSNITRTSVGVVTAVVGREIQVDFGTNSTWTGNSHELELVPHPSGSQSGTSINGDLIEDWSRCIRSLTVSSNESSAKHLLDRSQNYWQSSSSHGKHWIRLEMHENVLIHSLSITVSPNDCSHTPALVVVRVGDNISTLKDFSWVSVKPTDTQVSLLSDAKQFYQWIEIQIKHCRNNGIQCRVHALNVVGRRKQTDLEMMLMKASFLASEYSSTVETSSSASYCYSDEKSSNDQSQGCKVYVWGLNDKEQLGGLKGSKVKVPSLSTTLSQLRPIHISGGSKSLFVVSQDGKVYACGEGTNGRLGLGHNCNVSTPRQIPVLSQYVVKKVAVHSGGKHALALTLDGKVFSWGEGEDGKLGHGNRITLDKPKLIETLRSRRVRDIACGSSHSAAITSSGELFTWGLGEYGRLGHGDNCTQLRPKLVSELLGHRVVQVACGSRDAQTLALTEDGFVFSWGDGDFGKLGRGGSEGCSVPHQIERLNGAGVIQIECGAQFSLALTKVGEVWTWGKGDYYRLGHGSDQHVRKPTPVQGLRGKKIIHVAVGALHCLAVAETGQVFAWGDNDHGQQGSGSTMVNKKPCSVIGLEGVFVNRVACGSSHSIAWSLPQSPAEEDKKEPVPFSVAKDALGGNSLGIYNSEPQLTQANGKSTKPSLSENLLSLESYGARQTALNYVLNAMSILQARQCIVAALTSHSQLSAITEKNLSENEESTTELDQEQERNNNANILKEETIAHGGGEGPADVNVLVCPDATPDSEAAPPIPSAGPLAAFQSLTGSLSLSASISSCNATQKISKMSASAMSVMAATMTHHEEMVNETSLTGLDEFTSLLGESEAKSLIELLKLSVSGRTGPPSTVQTIANTLIALGSNNPTIGAMLLETCITELEDLCTSRHCLGKIPKPVVQETSHPYIDDVTLVGHVKIPGAEALRLEFDSQCSTEKRNDPLVIMDASGRVIATRSGREFAQWAPEIRIPGNEMRWKFTSDNSVNGWGWRFWVHAIMPTSFLQELSSDRAVLSQPSMDLVMALVDARIDPPNTNILLRLADALASCAQLSILSAPQRIWALKKLHSILLLKYAPRTTEPCLSNILTPLIPVLLKQYEYEEPQVRGGVHLTHSEYFKTLAALACEMELDAIMPLIETPAWAWFRRYCSAVRVAKSLINRNSLPKSFCTEVRRKLSEMVRPASVVSSSSGVGSMSPGPSSLTSGISSQTKLLYMDSLGAATSNSESEKLSVEDDQYLYEDHNLFKSQHDSQLLQWLNRRPEDWALSWGGASTIYGWGHNHRGQLGGLEGGKIKTPTPCEALSLLRPVQLAGGEQTLFSVTPDGKLFATGHGAEGRLGLGGSDPVSSPTLVESLQHVFVKKVAVHSGGKHCIALTADGEVYSWGEGEDGKLGHGNRISYDRPKLIEVLTGVGVVDIACGSAHSACITSQGTVITWGKGRYGRLGHGDSEDQLRPKTVEALLGYRVIDIACGSGDAQTLCITDDDNVWSWGDGDYGKLGRGGSEGCKAPMKIESLAGLGVIKVECGSQFSIALTRSGAVYTWGKGDYHRLGHGTVDHVRRPKKVAALQGKKIISIATGSLHCVACSDAGEVYTWGDNDEGQLGDGTVTAIQRPRLVTSLKGKLIVKVICGSAHTLALSTHQFGESVRAPPSPPLEYDLVRDLPPEALHARLVLLHHFSEILCPCLAMLPIAGDLSLGALKEVLVYSIKEAAFRKVIQTTMVRDKQHGPVIELNRIQVKRSRTRSAGGLAGVDGMKSVFGQMVQKLPLLTQEALSLPHRVWKVKFVGESVDDCGGGYSESIAEMCDELQNGSVPLLIQTPNGRGEAGANRDCFLLDPTLVSILQMNMFRFLGVLMGIAVRTGSPLSLNLAEPVWRQLAGETLRPSDLTEVDRDYVAGLLCIRDMEDDPKVFQTLELPFSTPSAKGHEVPLSSRYTRITPQNRQEYVKLALNYRLHEFDEQVKAVRDGMSKIIPVPLLSLFSAAELQAMVCGSPDIPLGLLKSVATYKGVESNSSLVQWFWDVMEEFTNQERSLFLRFVWGRTRLPRTIADFRGRDFVLQVLDKYVPPDHFLPESYTCFFLLKMPRYSCKSVLLEKLKYAIHFCKSIDTDEYARVAMGDPMEATGSEDNSDLESVISTQDAFN